MFDRGARTLPIETGGPLLWQPSSAADGKGVVVAVTGASTKAALHRTDSFIVMNPSSPLMRTQLYRWNGFGFSATEDAAADKRYREHYAD